ncbi:hypothetical protein U9M48_011381 [Paspalum notatum var. saurae]|uniref:Uncharacterized protein n=1 Tax=Paspalum notatum var. saurae TaxID=547442 RepID=A0AAQ3SVJ5_PASNO
MVSSSLPSSSTEYPAARRSHAPPFPRTLYRLSPVLIAPAVPAPPPARVVRGASREGHALSLADVVTIDPDGRVRYRRARAGQGHGAGGGARWRRRRRWHAAGAAAPGCVRRGRGVPRPRAGHGARAQAATLLRELQAVSPVHGMAFQRVASAQLDAPDHLFFR